MVDVQRQIRRQHAHQRHIFKVQPLGHHLGADEDGHFFLFKFAQHLLVPVADGVGVHAQDFCPGKQLPQFLFDALGAGADMLHRPAAIRTRLRRRLRIAAVVAHHPSVRGVVRQKHTAPRTLRHMAALRAQQLAAAAAAVEKKDALLARGEIALQLLAQGAADGRRVPRAQLLAQICHHHAWQTVRVKAPVKTQQLIFTVAREVRRLDRRRRRAEQQPRTLLRAAVLRDVARVVKRRAAGFIGALLLLVEHDQPQLAQRREHRRARAEHDVRLAAADALILVIALGQAKATVQQRHLRAEIGREPRHHLRRERNLRHQNHHGFPLAQQLLRKADIHKGLAAAGHALQKRHPGLARAALGKHAKEGRLLLVVEPDRLRRARRGARRNAVFLPRAQRDDARLFETAQSRGRHAREIAQVVYRRLCAAGEKVDGVALARCRAALALHARLRLLRLDGKRCELHHAVAHAAAALRAGGDKPFLLHRERPAPASPAPARPGSKARRAAFPSPKAHPRPRSPRASRTGGSGTRRPRAGSCGWRHKTCRNSAGASRARDGSPARSRPAPARAPRAQP